jgi:ADP-ribosylglycohydrolase
LALGDALGWPVEFRSLADIRARYGAHGIQEPPNPALYTDDTQMTLALAEGLLDAGPDAPVDALMSAVGKCFINWLHSPDNNRAPGGTCIQGVENYEAGIPWRESGLVASKGSGTAMRAAAIGLLYQHDPARLREVAIASSLMTHRHPAALAASVGAATLVKLALDGTPVESYMREVMSATDGLSDEFDLAILRVGHVLGWTDEIGSLAHIGQGWVGEEAVALALYCVLRCPNDYVSAVRLAVNHGGDSDTVGCIVGGIMGARLGLDAIPADWRARCENAAYLDDLALRLDAARL